MSLKNLSEKLGPMRVGVRWFRLVGAVLLTLLPMVPLLGEAGEMTFANLHYVDPADDFVGVEVSFFAMNRLHGRAGEARVEAFSAEVVDGEWIFFPRGVWPLALTWDDVIPASSEGFFEPRYSMIRLSLPADNPRPYEYSIFVVTVSIHESEIREERLFPNVWQVPAEAEASLVDMGDGNMNPGLRLEQLTVLMPEREPEPSLNPNANPNVEPSPAPLQQGSRESPLTSGAAPVNAGTHIMIHAHPQMGRP